MSSSILYHAHAADEDHSVHTLTVVLKPSGELPIGSLVELPLKLMIFYPVFHSLSFASFTEAVL